MKQTLDFDQARLDSVLTSAEHVFLENGIVDDFVPQVAEHSDVPADTILSLYSQPLDLPVAMLNREFTRMYQGILANIERDPRGGLLSRMYTYVFTEVYERPVARTLYMIDRSALHSLMVHQHAKNYVPSGEIQVDLVQSLQEAGMVRPTVEPELVSSAITVMSGGLALTAPHENLGEIVESLMGMLGSAFDTDADDTTPGKKAFYSWATSLDTAVRAPASL
ncbi:hypothetical protein N9K72_01245 [Pontimonas sp.]|nr:hypothetical protein [Pontimonas sp.]